MLRYITDGKKWGKEKRQCRFTFMWTAKICKAVLVEKKNKTIESDNLSSNSQQHANGILKKHTKFFSGKRLNFPSLLL